MVVKTFRGLLADGGQDRIRLQTIKGKVGYRIVKFQIVTKSPGLAGYENIVQIWKSEISSVPTASAPIDFSDSDLLAVALTMSSDSQGYGPFTPATIFDNEIFNQDIYITNTDNFSNIACNYYLELEVIPLDDAGAEYTTLKDMRQT